MPQTLSEFRDLQTRLFERLRAEGKLDRYNAKCREIKKETKLPQYVVYVAAALLADFQPTDGSPPEFTQAIYEERMAKLKGDTTPGEGAAAGLALTQILQGENRKALIDTAWDRLRRRVSQAIKSGRSRASDDEASVVRWVFRRAGTPVEDIDPIEVPGEGAVKLLRLVQDDSAYYADFVKSAYAKLLTKSLEGTNVGGYADDGRTRLRVMDRIDDLEGVATDEDLEELLGERDDEIEPEDFDDAADPETPVSRHGQTDAQGPEGESSTSASL